MEEGQVLGVSDSKTIARSRKAVGSPRAGSLRMNGEGLSEGGKLDESLKVQASSTGRGL